MGPPTVTLVRAVSVLVLALAAAAAGYWVQQRLAQPGTRAQALKPAATHAPKELSFRNIDGSVQKIDQWTGKLLLINFWASWCGPCLHEMPLLIEAQKEFGARGLQVIGPALDEVEDARRQASMLGVNYPVMVGDADITGAMDALGDSIGALPFTVLVGPDGRILERISGVLTREHLKTLIEANLPS